MLRRYISRPRYERMLDAHRGTNDIKIITGVRRCGKSSLMRNLVERMTRELGEGNVFYRRMDTFGVPLNPTAEWLQGELLAALERADSARPVAVLLDEIQDIPDWEKVVRRLHALERVDVYLTGSNAHVLSSDLATLLGGRYVELHVMPLSFTEFEAFWNEAGMARIQAWRISSPNMFATAACPRSSIFPNVMKSAWVPCSTASTIPSSSTTSPCTRGLAIWTCSPSSFASCSRHQAACSQQEA